MTGSGRSRGSRSGRTQQVPLDHVSVPVELAQQQLRTLRVDLRNSKVEDYVHRRSISTQTERDQRSESTCIYNQNSVSTQTPITFIKAKSDGALRSEVISECNICHKHFSTRSNMLRHAREHLGRRILCQFEGCPSSFTQQSSLQVHMAVHKGLKPYKCELCGKLFLISHNLVCHLRTHTGESPFECAHCEKKFKQKSNLVRHFKLRKCHLKPKQNQDEGASTSTVTRTGSTFDPSFEPTCKRGQNL